MKLKWFHYIITAFIVISSIKIAISLFRSSPWIVWDELAYIDIGEKIFHGKLVIIGDVPYTHPYPAGYSYFIAPAFLLGDIGRVYHGMLAINCILSSLIIFPAYLVSRNFLEEKESILLAIAITILPAITLHNFSTMSENAFIPLFLLSAWFIMKSFLGKIRGYKKIILDIITGFSIIFLILIKATSIAMFLALIFLFIYKILKEKSFSIIKEKILVIIPFIASIPIAFYMLSTENTLLGYDSILYLDRVFSIFKDASSLFSFVKVFINELNYYFLASYFVFMVFTIFIFIYWKKLEKERQEKLFIFCFYTLLSTLFLILITDIHIYGTHEIYTRYVSPTLPSFFILGTIGLKIYRKEMNYKSSFYVAIIFLIIFSIFLIFFPIQNYKLVNNLDIYFIDMASNKFLTAAGIISFFMLLCSLVLLLFLSFLYFKPKIIVVLIISMLVSLIITAPILQKEFGYSLGKKEDNKIIEWLCEHDVNKIAIEKNLKDTIGERIIKEKLIFWWRGEITYVSIENVSNNVHYFISQKNYVDQYPIVITYNSWKLYEIK
ncbi:MAG TPA: hypothetical protein ENI52_03795 [Thermoplasmata archaeon]|nr:hypothetical protein [Thermoplasmata archaeon]